MRRHDIPTKTSTEMGNAFRNIIDDLEDNNVERIYNKRSLNSLQERKRVWLLEDDCLCSYVKFGGKLYRTLYTLDTVDVVPFTEGEQDKLNGVQKGAQTNPPPPVIKTEYESNPNTNPLTDSLLSKLQGLPTHTQLTQQIADAIMAAPDEVGLTNAEVQTLINAAASVKRLATLPGIAQAEDDVIYLDVDASDTLEAVRIKSTRPGAYFNVTFAQLASGYIGYARFEFSTASYGIILPDGGSTEFAQIHGIAEQHDPTQGNRWVLLFGNATAPVDDSDRTLTLYTEEGGSPITLTRNITFVDGIVFESAYDGAAAHSRSVGDSLSMGLFRADGTQVYQGAGEPAYQSLPIRQPIIKTRGALLASSNDLPTGATTSELNTTWTVETDAPDGFEVNASDDDKLDLPQLHPYNVSGIEAVALVGGIEVDQTVMPWGPGSLQADGSGEEYSIHSLQFDNDSKIDVRYAQRSIGLPYLSLYGDGDTLPANSTVKLYLSGVFIS